MSAIQIDYSRRSFRRNSPDAAVAETVEHQIADDQNAS